MLIRLAALALSLLPLAGHAQRVAVSREGMVVAAEPLAAEVGAAVLAKGGNSVDAAVAVGFALAVTWPAAGNLGGGGFMLVRAPDGKAVIIDYRERAAAGAGHNMYLGPEGTLIKDASTVGHRAAGVPGTVAGLEHAHRMFGKLPWTELVEPARKLAEEGFRVSAALEIQFRGARELFERFPAGGARFFPGGEPPRAGAIFRQPDLAATLSRIRRDGAQDFYRGETARLIAADMEANGGLITLADLAAYRVAERQPLRGLYRGYELLTMPPPSSGGVALIQMLAMLERFDLRSMGHNSARYVHVASEAMRRAFADRAEYLGDADFADVPIGRLLDPDYLASRAASIDLGRATPSETIGPGLGPEHSDTTHFTIVDRDGMIVSNTYTLNGSFGCGAVVAGAGFLLNNEMDDFAAQPGKPNMFGLVQGEANAIAPGKHPLSSMSPSLLLKDGKPVLAVGSPGGPTIITTVLQVILNSVDFGMSPREAVDAPRFHHQWLPDRIELESGWPAAYAASILRAMGHTVRAEAGSFGRVAAVSFGADGTLTGVFDGRGDGAAR